VHVPSAAQRVAKRNGALQTRDRRKFRAWYGPGLAAHHFVLRRFRGTLAAQHCQNRGRRIASDAAHKEKEISGGQGGIICVAK